MRVEVKMFVGGKVFTEEVKLPSTTMMQNRLSLARNPNARVVGVNAKF